MISFKGSTDLTHFGITSILLLVLFAHVIATLNGPRIEIKPSVPIVLFEAQTISNKVLTCKALGDKPGMFNSLRWSGPNRWDNWDELSKRHKIKETTRNGHALELEFQRPTPDDSGVYYCHGTYQSSDVYNASITIKVYNPIKLENCPERQFVIKGNTGQKVTCRITGDSPSVVFFKNSTPIDQLGNRYQWDNDDGLEIIGQADESDAGVYTIEVTADLTGERKLQHINVGVHSKPEIISPNMNSDGQAAPEFTGIEGESAELKCQVTGSPKPLVYWFDPRLRNLTSVGGYFVNPESGTLLVSKLNRVDDNGNFVCVASNTVDEARRNVTMSVLQRPAIVAFENKTVDENTEATFECRATGFPKPHITVRRHGLNQQPYLVGDGNVTDIDETEEGGGANVYVYRVTIRGSKSQFGIHYCNATNPAGSAERVGQLTVRHKPDLSQTLPEQFVKLGRKITVTCHIKAFPTPTVTWYADNQQLINIESSFKTSPDGQTHIVTMMPPISLQSTSTRFRCVAQNVMGTSEQIIIPRYTTKPGMVNAVILETTPTTVKMQLNVINDGGDRIKSFKYRVEGVTLDPFNPLVTYPHDRQKESYLDASLSSSIYTIRNLFPYYSYKISISAVNDIGDGDVTEIHADTRKPTRPEAPVIIKPTTMFSPQSSGYPSEYSNGYLLRWSPPDLDNGDPIQRYIVKFFRVNAELPDVPLDDGEEQVFEQMNERPLHARIGPLDANQRYKILLRARNKYGDSEASSIVIYTAHDLPMMPDFSPQALTWFTEPSTPVIVALLILAILSLIIIDLMFCFCFQIGVTNSIRKCCCRDKANSVISDKTYS